MLVLFWLVLFVLAATAFLMVPFLVGREFYLQYRGSRAVTCPENGQSVAVSLDAFHAATSQLAGKPKFHLAQCTRWPERADCGQQCVADALRAAPYTKGEVAPPAAKSIYHLPVLIAAFAAWALGAIWHSHYLFRADWIQAVGLSRPQVHQLVWRLYPHLLTVAVPLLFAYGVAWVLALSKRIGLWHGLVTALILWAALAGVSLGTRDLAGIPAELLKLELAYTLLASALVGMVIGGLGGKLNTQVFAGK